MSVKKVSIVMTVYNHERFLAQALESVLMQKTDFDWELIVGEDCSPDGSRDILRSYEERFGDRLVPLYREKNLGMFGNVSDCMSRCTGEYIAVLEGDDYWTCPDKLQKQADFLDAHPDYTAVYHNCDIVDIEGKYLRQWSEHTELWEYTLGDFEKFDLPGQTGTVMVRVNGLSFTENNRLLNRYRKVPLDRTAVLLTMKAGRIGVLPESMSAYRYYREAHGSNWTSTYIGRLHLEPIKYYSMKRQSEKLAHELGFPAELHKVKMTEYKRAQTWKGRSKPLMLLQCLLILLAEGHPVRYLREYAEIKDELSL